MNISNNINNFSSKENQYLYDGFLRFQRIMMRALKNKTNVKQNQISVYFRYSIIEFLTKIYREKHTLKEYPKEKLRILMLSRIGHHQIPLCPD